MTAEKMFKNLGYKKDTSLEQHFITYTKVETHSVEDGFMEFKWDIVFIPHRHEPNEVCFYFYVNGNQTPEFSASVKELEAIQQQIKEMGWTK